MPLESEPKPVCIKVHINSSYPQPLALKTSHKCSLDFLFLQARTEQSEISQIFLQLSTYKALNLSHNQKNPKKHKPKRNPNKLTHKEIKIWLYKIAAIFFSVVYKARYFGAKKPMHCRPTTKHLKTYIHSHFVIKISTNLIGTSKKHLLHTSMLKFSSRSHVWGAQLPCRTT